VTLAPSGGGSAAGTLIYSLTFTGTPTSNITAAHIHAGTSTGGITPAGTGGGVVRVNLCGAGTAPACPAGAGTIPNTTLNYVTGADTLLNSVGTTAARMTFDGLVAALKASNVYVNVHTTNNPGGEARAQPVPLP